MMGSIKGMVWIGIVVLFVPFFGIPDSVRTGLTIIIGVLVIYMSFKLKYLYKKIKFESRQALPDVETTIHG